HVARGLQPPGTSHKPRRLRPPGLRQGDPMRILSIVCGLSLLAGGAAARADVSPVREDALPRLAQAATPSPQAPGREGRGGRRGRGRGPQGPPLLPTPPLTAAPTPDVN